MIMIQWMMKMTQIEEIIKLENEIRGKAKKLLELKGYTVHDIMIGSDKIYAKFNDKDIWHVFNVKGEYLYDYNDQCCRCVII